MHGLGCWIGWIQPPGALTETTEASTEWSLQKYHVTENDLHAESVKWHCAIFRVGFKCNCVINNNYRVIVMKLNEVCNRPL